MYFQNQSEQKVLVYMPMYIFNKLNIDEFPFYWYIYSKIHCNPVGILVILEKVHSALCLS